MALFELPEDFIPGSMVHRASFSFKDEYPKQFESERLKEVKRLNEIGSTITDYLALIQSGATDLSDFQALSLAVELYKIETLKDLSIDGNVNIRGSVGIDDGVYVRGDIDVTERKRNV